MRDEVSHGFPVTPGIYQDGILNQTTSKNRNKVRSVHVSKFRHLNILLRKD
jgi:hypothetical protein